MQRREWQALGQALKDLRTGLDLAQKEVVNRTGEELGERALRSYESGEQRPNRERLLRLLTKSFELNGASEINHYLELGRYATLSLSEILQLGLESAAAEIPGTRSRPGLPVDFRAEVSTLIVADAEGKEVWRHRFPTRFAHRAYEGSDSIKRCSFGDIDGDGRVETVFSYLPLNFGSVGSTLYCFAEDGSIKWEFVPGRMVKDSTGRQYWPPYTTSNVQVIPIANAETRIMVSSNHYLHNANQIAMLDPSGKQISEYWHSGHLRWGIQCDINGDGIDEILLAGVNNGYRRATMLVFDPRNVSGASHQPGRQILDCPPGTELAVVIFPRSCLSDNAPYTRAQTIWVTRESRIVLPVVEGYSEDVNPGVMIYELDFDLNVISARPDSHFLESHRTLETEGVLEHRWSEEEAAGLRRGVIVRRQP